jgi:hypothetical protein
MARHRSLSTDLESWILGLCLRLQKVVQERNPKWATVADRAELGNSKVVLLAAREVSGEKQVMFDLKAAIVFGLVTGAVIGLLKMLSGRRESETLSD